MLTCYIIRGLSGSGKSTMASAVAFANISERPFDYICSADQYFLVKVGDKFEYKFDARLLGEAHRKCFSKFLNLIRAKSPTVIVDNTNILSSEVTPYFVRAKKEGYEVKILEPDNELWLKCSEELNGGKLSFSLIKELAARNTHGVTTDIIQRRAHLWIPTEKLEKELEAGLVTYTSGLKNCVICDIDGTLAIKGQRNAYDWSRVGEDTINEPVYHLLNAIQNDGMKDPEEYRTKTIFFSGRDGVCYKETRDWLDFHGFSEYPLYLRAAGDCRKDTLVKREMFDQHIRGKFNVKFAIDDRDCVISMWRNELGLDTFQVAEGDF